MASLQANLAKYFVRQLRQQSLHLLNDLDRLRAEQDKALMRIRPPRNVKFVEAEALDFNAEWAKPSFREDRHPKKVILYMHGGGYAVGAAYSHRGLVGKIVSETGIKALNLDYRLAPEHPFPAALDDSIAAYQWLIEVQQYEPNDIIVMGDSAGGGLCLSTLLKIKELGLKQPLTAVTISPWTDLSLSGDSIQTHQDKDPLLLSDHAAQWASWYYHQEDPQHPHVSPLFGNYESIAPIYVQVGTEEILLSDSLRLIEVAKEYDARILVDIWDGMMHVWHFGWPYVPEARDAISKIAEYVEGMIDVDMARQNPKIDPFQGAGKTQTKDSQRSVFESWLRYGSDMLKNILDNN
jgi:monoterpene epsilon-lactone hydrolase